MATPWQGTPAFKERVLGRLISSANCSNKPFLGNLGLLSCYCGQGTSLSNRICYRAALAFPLLFLRAEQSEDAFIFC